MEINSTDYNLAIEENIRDHLMQDKKVMMCVASNSMSPIFSNGDLIEVHAVDIEDVCVGDVVVFARNARLYTHRVVKKIIKKSERLKLRTKGDTAWMFDRSIDKKVLLGVVAAREHHQKKVYFDNFFWRCLNLLIAKLSVVMGQTYLFLRNIKRWMKRRNWFGLNNHEKPKL